MTKNDKIERWGGEAKRDKFNSHDIYVCRNSEGLAAQHDGGKAVYIKTKDSQGYGVVLTVSEAREVAAAIVAAADEFELILAEPDVLEPSIRDQVEALPVGSTFRVHFEEGSAEYLRQKSGLTLYRATYDDVDGVDETPHDMDVNLPAWRFALSLEILHLAE